MCERYGIQLHHSSPYYPQGNGQAEATNKTLIKILKKNYKSNKFFNWPKKLIDALWAYHTSIQTLTRQTPYVLTFEMEAMLSYEIFLPSLRVQLGQKMSESEHLEVFLIQLELLDERRLRVAKHVHVYQKRLSKFYQKNH